MGKVLQFNKLKLGEIITVQTGSKEFKCEVLSNEGDSIYKLRILEGTQAGKFCYFMLQGFEDEQ